MIVSHDEKPLRQHDKFAFSLGIHVNIPVDKFHLPSHILFFLTSYSRRLCIFFWANPSFPFPNDREECIILI